MRIIAGKHRGRVLKEFEKIGVRPTADRAREALFNILQFEIAGSSFLDLFCGTGAVGIEAISRGAESVVFVDNSKESVKLTEENLATVKEKGKVFFSDASLYLTTTSEKFDFIFLDPPYSFDEADGLLKIVKERNLLKEGGRVIYEHDGGKNFESEYLKVVSNRKYGIATFTFMENFEEI